MSNSCNTYLSKTNHRMSSNSHPGVSLKVRAYTSISQRIKRFNSSLHVHLLLKCVFHSSIIGLLRISSQAHNRDIRRSIWRVGHIPQRLQQKERAVHGKIHRFLPVTIWVQRGMDSIFKKYIMSIWPKVSFDTTLHVTRGIQYFLSLIVFCGQVYNWDVFHLGIANYTFYLSKDKIQYWYDHFFAHRTKLHNRTLIHCRFNMSRKQDKSPGNSGVYVDSTWSSCSSKYHIKRSFL